MIDAAALRLLRPHAYVINCARGGVIVERDLLDALDAGVLAGAAIDVVAEEPPPPGGTGAALHRHPKVIATPHLGGSTHEALARIATELAHDVARVLLGAPASGAVNAPGPRRPRRRARRAVPRRRVPAGPLLSAVRAPAAHAGVRARARRCARRRGAASRSRARSLSGLLQATTDRRVSVVNAERDRARARHRRRPRATTRARRRTRRRCGWSPATRRSPARRSPARRASSSSTATRSTRRPPARC